MSPAYLGGPGHADKGMKNLISGRNPCQCVLRRRGCPSQANRVRDADGHASRRHSGSLWGKECIQTMGGGGGGGGGPPPPPPEKNNKQKNKELLGPFRQVAKGVDRARKP